MKVILILNNAAYQHGMEKGPKSPLKVKNRESASLLDGRGIGAVSVIRNRGAGTLTVAFAPWITREVIFFSMMIDSML